MLNEEVFTEEWDTIYASHTPTKSAIKSMKMGINA
jgi:hypothetical protein